MILLVFYLSLYCLTHKCCRCVINQILLGGLFIRIYELAGYDHAGYTDVLDGQLNFLLLLDKW